MKQSAFFVRKNYAMKYGLLSVTFLFVLLFSLNTHAQDILTFKNGDALKVKVQEITPQEIKYKRFDNLNGPLISILKSTAQSIQYENGVIEKLVEDVPVVPSASYVNPANTNTQPVGFGVGDIVETDYYNDIYKGVITEANISKLTAVVDLNKNGKSVKVNRQFFELTLIEKAKNSDAIPSASYVANPASQPISQPSSDLYFQGQTDAKRYYKGYTGAGTGTFFTALLAGPIIGLIPAAACSSTSPSLNHLYIPNPQLAQNTNYISGYTQEAHRIKSRKVWGNYGIGAGIAIVAVLALTSSYR